VGGAGRRQGMGKEARDQRQETRDKRQETRDKRQATLLSGFNGFL